MQSPEPPETSIPKPARRFGHAERFLAIATALLIALAVIILFRQDWIARLNQTFSGWQALAVQHGYWGVFVAMLVGNVTIVILLPTTVVPFLVAASGLDPIAIAIISGLGAELGECSGYILGRWGSRYVQRKEPEAYRMVESIAAKRPRSIPVLLYIFSVLPLPDDVLFIPLGLIRYPFWKLFWPSLLGKITAGFFIAYGGVLTKGFLENSTITLGSVLWQVAALEGLVVVMYIFLRLPWTAVLRRFAPPNQGE